MTIQQFANKTILGFLKEPHEYQNKQGIYIIKELETGNPVYVGLAQDFYQRWLSHSEYLLQGRHYNKPLQEFYDTKDLKFEIFFTVTDKEIDLNYLRKVEKELIHQMRESYKLCNVQHNNRENRLSLEKQLLAEKIKVMWGKNKAD